MGSSRYAITLLIWSTTGLVSMAAAPAVAPQPVPTASGNPSPSIGPLIAQLASDDPVERMTATNTLASLTTIDPDQLAIRLVDPSLTDEQRRRLRAAAEQRFIDSDPPGLGVQFSARTEGEGVRIERVIEEFPAAGVLEAGDSFLTLHGQPLQGTTHMRILILSHRPGERLPGLIERTVDGVRRTLEVEIPLGSYADLRNNVPPPVSDRRLAFMERLARLGIDDAGYADTNREIGSAVTPRDWLTAEGYWPDDALSRPTELGLATPRSVGSAFDPSRAFAIAGRPADGTERDAIRRGGDLWRERMLTQELTRGGFETDLGASIAAIRFTVRRLVEIRRQLADLDGRVALPNRDARKQSLERERADNIANLAEFVGVVERASGAADDAEAEPEQQQP